MPAISIYLTDKTYERLRSTKSKPSQLIESALDFYLVGAKEKDEVILMLKEHIAHLKRQLTEKEGPSDGVDKILAGKI